MHRKKSQNEKTGRFLLIDGLRGIAVISMVIFHFLFDVNEVFGFNTGWYENVGVYIWQQSICWSFIIISGFVWQLGKKSNLKRGVFLNICGIVITVVTSVFTPSQTVWFGILNFMGCAVLILIPLHRLTAKIPPLPGMGVSVLLFGLCRNIAEGFIGSTAVFIIELPKWLYEIKILTPLGFPFPDFTSSDYFPILPWIALFLFGYYLYSFVIENDNLKNIFFRKIPILSGIGQYSIWIYLLHQPICMAVCALILG